MIRVDLLRHGELEGGVKYRGQTDDPLTAAGRASMEYVWKRLRDDVDLVISSPLERCRQPAVAWARAAGIPCKTDPRVAEMRYGEWEGLTSEEIMARYPGMLEQWRADPAGMLVPGGESAEQLRDRIAAFWSEVCDRHDGKHLLVVAHSGSIRMLLAHILAAPIATMRSMQMPYGCWSRVTHDNGSSQLVFHNREI
ncbi:MAG: histidine phosphatase family protein [Mariprofundaceae bacterium]|nr:histidine phosphatase family protein [Mariprofundaceae bacterium]